LLLLKLSKSIAVTHEVIPAFLFSGVLINQYAGKLTLNPVSIQQCGKIPKKKKEVSGNVAKLGVLRLTN